MSLGLAAGLLRCPVCRDLLTIDERSVRCGAGHSFDVAREGYVTLLGGSGVKVSGDTADMLAARANFLEAGHYQPIVDGVVSAVTVSAVTVSAVTVSAVTSPTAILEIGAGTGHYLANVLDVHPEAVGIGFDVSKPAARRIAKRHPRVAAVVADAWRDWPFADAAFSHVMSIFAPRNAPEIHRVLVPGGAYVVVTPQADHLAELLQRIDLVRVDQDKADRLRQTLEGRFTLESTDHVRFTVDLSAAEAGQAIAMGPSGHHLDAAGLAALIESLPVRSTVTVAVNVAVYRASITSE